MNFFILEEGLEYENDLHTHEQKEVTVYNVLCGLCLWYQGNHWNIQVTDL